MIIEQNSTRTLRGKKGIQLWRNNFGQGIFEYFPGFGKTYIASQIIQEMSNVKDTPTLIIVHSNLMAQQWSDIIEELGIKGCEVMVIHKIVINQLNITGFRLIIFDRICRYFFNCWKLLRVHFTTK